MKHSHSHPKHDSGDKHSHSHGHSHGAIDASILTTDRGLWAVKWSFIGLAITAFFQFIVVMLSSSIALFADMIHNIGDAATAIPLGIAFALAKLKPTKRFTYGYGRVEDLAGVAVVLTILASATVAGYESINRFFHPHEVSHIGAVIVASIVGFLGNEAVAVFRIRVGKEIGSAALIADGYHARVDGFTSLSVLVSAIGVKLGFPLADPIVGLLITLVLLKVVWDSIKIVFVRLLDGIEPEIVEELRHAVEHVPEVREVTDIRARWIGHKVHAELNVSLDPKLSVEQAHEIAKEVRHQLFHHLKYLSNAIVHIDPATASGEAHHRIKTHSHGNLSAHSHE
jgi:cation diffusion facilitator family transporter